jgi:hypothetical protein
MKIKIILLSLIVLALGSVCLAQTKTKTKTKTNAAATADAVVKNLYAAKGAASPFFQKKSRALVDKYFTRNLADIIWKDATSAGDGVGALNFNPLFYAQDDEITDFVIGRADENGMVKVKFKNFGKPEEITFSLTKENTSSKVWKIDSIVYSDAEDLGSILEYGMMTEAEMKEAEKMNKLDGDYLVGGVKCNITETRNTYWARVKCDDQENFQVIDTESMTFGTFNPNEKGRKGRFVSPQYGVIEKFVDASGKEFRVTRIPDSNPASDTKSSIRSVDFLNYSYQSTVCAEDSGISKTVKVTKGKFKDGDNYYNVKDNKFMFADANGDGREDAVVTIDCGSSAGTLRSFEIHVFSFEDGKAKTLATLDSTQVTEDYTKHFPDGYVFQIPQNGVTVDGDGTLVVDVLTDGSFAMPANVSTFIYKLNRDKFVLTAKPKKRKFKG